MHSNTALVVIDVQRGLFDPQPRPFEADIVLQKINSLLLRARAEGVLVVFVQHETQTGSLVFESEGWELEMSLTVEDSDEVVRKTTSDAFNHSRLDQLLAEHDICRLVVCGYASEFCVDTSVRRAAALGYAVVLVADAHTTHNKPHATAAAIREHHNATLPDLTSFGVKISAVMCDKVEF